MILSINRFTAICSIHSTSFEVNTTFHKFRQRFYCYVKKKVYIYKSFNERPILAFTLTVKSIQRTLINFQPISCCLLKTLRKI